MKLLFISQYFYPEEFRGNEIAEDWVKRGDDVTVITAIPNYPAGKFFKGYGLFQKRREKVMGINIIRVPVFPRGSGSRVMLMLNYLSFAVSSSFICAFHSLRKKYDIVFVQQLSPVTMAIPALIVRKIQKIPLVLWVLDLWPESLTSAGNVNNRYVIRFFNWIVKKIYQHSDQILISSASFRHSIISKGDFNHKINYFPNWAEDSFEHISNKPDKIPNLPDGFIVMFAGNLGEAQDLESVFKAILQLKNQTNIKFVFLGDGRKKKWIENYIEMNGLQDSVLCLGRYPIKTMPQFFEKADVMLVSLKNELIFNYTLPAKVQAYMLSGKPIIGMLNGEGAQLIDKATCGYCVEAGNFKELALKIQQLSITEKQLLKQLGENGKRYANLNFNKSMLMDELYNNLNRLSNY